MAIQKRAFTLSEVLITMAVIGIISALTIPQMVSNTNKSTIGAAVARGVEAVETGVANIFSVASKRAAGSSDIYNSIASLQVKDIITGIANSGNYLTNGTTLFSVTQGIMGSKEIQNKINYLSKIKEYTGSSTALSASERSNAFPVKIGKNKAIIIQSPMSDNQITTYLNSHPEFSDIPTDLVIGKIYIDGNGEDNPNRLGYDVFLFGITNSGKLVPAGSQAYNNNIFNETVPLYTNSCSGTNVTEAKSCSARLIKDNWKITYMN